MWSHLSPLKCEEVCQGCSGRQQRKYGRLIQQNQREKKASGEALAVDMGIPISELIQSFKGGRAENQGTWVHPDIAINLAQWLSPKFAVQVSRWVREWMSG